MEVTKQKEESDKRLLHAEIYIGISSTVFLFILLFVGIYFIENKLEWLGIISIVFGFLQVIIMYLFALRIEQKAGYYECPHCRHRYVPTFKQINRAPHFGRTRYMRCPKCGKRSWNKKVLSASQDN